MCYNNDMKMLFKILLGIFLLSPLPANAVTFNVLVLPADVENVCNNYYCFDEVSNIVAGDVIENFSGINEINSPTLEVVRAKLNTNNTLRALTVSTLRKFNSAGNLDMQALKNISNEFGVKSILLISSNVKTRNTNIKRGVWEILDLSSGFDIVYPYELETDAVLIDTVNGLVMWSGSFNKKLGNKNNEFQAKTPSQAAAKFEQLSMYSKAIVARNVAQNVKLRFFPKVSEPVVPKASNPEKVSPSAFFRIDSTTPMYSTRSQFDNSEIKGINEGDFGEIIYGL